ncbi:cytidine deaminase-like protein [Gymnopus androsaceus JB14]|uniref:Cytosine deaminase n=1 Tax=Gymnopus androsaceus JB14 TaxID=1447944 RepID=A0A6A4HER7_9AGAR|nr:cytidine deaminase-like protein [Gymnopus androsaceus JB14]
MPSSLLTRRKARLNTCFREECEDRDVTGDQKIALLATFIGFLEEYLGEAEAEAGVKHEQGVEIFAADQKAWEEFKTKFFPEAPLYMRINTVMAEGFQPIHVPLLLLPSHAPGPKPKPIRKPGWKRDTESSLLKVVLVSNAQSILSPSKGYNWAKIDLIGMTKALEQARKSFTEGGIPIGCSLIAHDGAILGIGHNERIQKKSATLHGEISALENAGRLKASVYRDATIYTTLSPCNMCTGAILLYKIPRVVIGENTTFKGGEDLLKAHSVDVVVLDDEECKDLMAKFIRAKPEEWNEDIGED